MANAVVRVAALAAAGVLFASGCAAPRSPHFAAHGPSATLLGAEFGYPVAAIYRPRFFVGAFSHNDQLLEARRVPRAAEPSVLRRAERDISVAYHFDGQTRSLDDYLSRNPTTGLLIARGDTILVEHYQYARHDRHRFMSASMAKTVIGMLVGIAIDEGFIHSIDDPAERYVPVLAGTEYGRTPLRHLLQMSSGVRFDERYTGDDDFARLWAGTVAQVGSGGPEVMKSFNQRQRRSGAVFSYSSADTQMLGLVLAAAVRRPITHYLHQKLWAPMGAEADASWIVDAAGQEAAYCCLNAVLRDYARLALVLAHDGRAGERQLIPAAWVRAATTLMPDDAHLQLVWPEAGFGYGYQTWIFNAPGDPPRRMFALLGVHGQAIFVDPASQLVLVQTAVRPLLGEPYLETQALWRALVAQCRDQKRCP